MAGSRDRRQAGQDLAARLIAFDVLSNGREDTPDALETAFHAVGSLRHPGIVHPEIPFGSRHHDFGLGKYHRAVLEPEAVDVVAVKMAEHHRADLRRVEARGL